MSPVRYHQRLLSRLTCIHSLIYSFTTTQVFKSFLCTQHDFVYYYLVCSLTCQFFLVSCEIFLSSYSLEIIFFFLKFPFKANKPQRFTEPIRFKDYVAPLPHGLSEFCTSPSKSWFFWFGFHTLSDGELGI